MKPTRADLPDSNLQRRLAREEVKTRLANWRLLPEAQQRRLADLFADELVGAVLKITETHV